MKKNRYNLTKDIDVKESVIFDSNGDTISCINVEHNNENKILGIIKDNGVTVYIELFTNSDMCSFFKKAELYCHNNPCKAFYTEIAECKEEMKAAAQYVCECTDQYKYYVYSKNSENVEQTPDEKKSFPYWSFFKGTDTNGELSRKTLVKQLFLVLAFSAAVLERLEISSIITAILMHNGHNKLLNIIMQGVYGKVSDFGIKNPKESHSRLEYHSVFNIEGGTKQADFGETVNYIKENYIGSYLYCFNTQNVFPFDANNSLDIKCNTFLVSEDFEFSKEECEKYYVAVTENGTNYLNEFKLFIRSEMDKYNYKDMRLIYENEIYKDTTTKVKLSECSAVIELTGKLLNDCFDVDINVEAVCRLFGELNLTEIKAMSIKPDDIIKKIGPIMKIGYVYDLIYQDGRVAFEYNNVAAAIKKEFTGISHITILRNLVSAGYICCGTRKRDDGIIRVEKYKAGHKVIEFWRDKIEEMFEDNIVSGSEAEAA